MIESIKGAYIAPALSPTKPSGTAGPADDSFNSLLKESINKVSTLQNEADTAIQGLAKGEVKNIHETMIAIEKANISFNLMLQVRNKLLAAYEEVMRMQV